ncbi:MAG: cytidine deaminase [Tissierellia bacterium]|nr:cytidine deaminase [Tissierellia bacterium]
MDHSELMRAAVAAQKMAYIPYSGYPVGAAVETEDGSIYTGCNIENAAYSPTACAERVAIFKAVSEGHRKIERIAIVAGDNFGYPCGVCRQVIREFIGDGEIVVGRGPEEYRVYHMEDLLPHSFGPEDLGHCDHPEVEK